MGGANVKKMSKCVQTAFYDIKGYYMYKISIFFISRVDCSSEYMLFFSFGNESLLSLIRRVIKIILPYVYW